MRAVPAAIDLSERRHDLRHDVPVPFASDPFAGYGTDPRLRPTGPADLGGVVKARAIQCALSRVCGLCGLSLATGPAAATTFVGSVAEADANTFATLTVRDGKVDAIYLVRNPDKLGHLAEARDLTRG